MRKQDKREIDEILECRCSWKVAMFKYYWQSVHFNSSWNPYIISIIVEEFPPDQHSKKGLYSTPSFFVPSSLQRFYKTLLCQEYSFLFV